MGGLCRWVLAVVSGALLVVVVLAGASALGAPAPGPRRAADVATDRTAGGRVELAVPARLPERPSTLVVGLLGPAAAVVAVAVLGPGRRPWFRLAVGDSGPAPRGRRPVGARRRAPPRAAPPA